MNHLTGIPNGSVFAGQRHILHGGDYNPDQWLHAPQVIDEDFRLMPIAGCNTFTLGVFAWCSLEPEEGRYEFAWLDAMMDRMANAGHGVILATPSGAWPGWLAHRYPEVRRVRRDGVRDPHDSRHNHCWTSPVYREKTLAMNKRLAERYGKHPALRMWHVSNEFSGECLCPGCIDAFRGWLQNRYGTLEAINLAWWSTFWSRKFSDWSEIHPLIGNLDGCWLDWRRFVNFQMRDFYLWEAAPLRAASPNIPVTTNFMGLSKDHDYAAFADLVDVVTDDHYPMFDPLKDVPIERQAAQWAMKNDLFRCFKKNRAWMLMEATPGWPQGSGPMRFKRPGAHQTEMLQAIGQGADGTCYFQWRKGRGGFEKLHGAVVDHTGGEATRVFRDVAALGALYEALAPVVGTRCAPASVALIFDSEVRWAFEMSTGTPSANDAYLRVALDHYQPFLEQGVAVDVIASDRDFDGYALLIAPQLWMLKPGVAERLRRFVENGGTVVATQCMATCDESNLCFTEGRPGAGLMEVFGVWEEEFEHLLPGETRLIKPTTVGRSWLLGDDWSAAGAASRVQTRGAEVLATYADSFYAGEPALTVNRFGSGHAFYQAARMSLEFQKTFYRSLSDRLGIVPVLPGERPAGVSIHRRDGAESSYYFICNFTAAEHVLDLGSAGLRQAATGEPVSVLRLASMGSDVLIGAAFSESEYCAAAGASESRPTGGDALERQ